MGSEVEATADWKDVVQLSLISNVLADHRTGKAEDLAEFAATEIPKRMDSAGLSGWSVAWGPMVYKHLNISVGGPDLVAYVANKADTYVVAIAGTNKHSVRAKYVYDIEMKKGVDFEAWRSQSGAIASPPKALPKVDPSKANIAEGTAKGVYELVTAKTTVGLSKGMDIVTYLKSLKSASKLIYTGHSLGGALSPTVALGLLNELKNINPKNVSTLPTGAPTPGNAKFVDLFTRAFQADGEFNRNFINTRDPVPFAWSIENDKFPQRCMQYLRDVFGHIPDNCKGLLLELKKLVDWTESARDNGMVYAFLPSHTFTGKNQLKYEPPKILPQYMADFHVTHVDDYKTYWNVQAELGDIEVGLPLPFGPQLAEYTEESTSYNNGDNIGSEDAAGVDGKTTNEGSEL